MFYFRKLRRGLCSLLSVLMFTFSVPSISHAGIVTTTDLVSAQQTSIEREQIREWLTRDEVRDYLTGMGVDVDAAQARVDSMTSDEVTTMAANIDEMPAGAGVLEAALIVLLILILLDIAGTTDIFPNI